MQMGRDPRFDDLSGEYNETFFNTAYSFLDDVKQVEKEVQLTISHLHKISQRILAPKT